MSDRQSHQSDHMLGRRLRPEANSLDWPQLNASQREAFRRSLYLIREAVKNLSTDPYEQSPSALLDEQRESRSLFLSGDRGNGKTTVLLSLMDYTLPRPGRLSRPTDQSPRFHDALATLRERVVWLKPIDMEPLPTPFSLLASLLIPEGSH